jgi:hypothetical protein
MEAETIITDIDCSGPESNQHGCNADVRPAGEIIAGGAGIDSCYGDSGGPLYLLTNHGAFLIGVTARALDDSTEACGEGGIYERPDAAMAWIEQTGGITLEPVSCTQWPIPEITSMKLEVGEDTDDEGAACASAGNRRAASWLAAPIAVALWSQRRRRRVPTR